MTTTQPDNQRQGIWKNTYYCEYCKCEYGYRDDTQMTCETCNRLIDDNQRVNKGGD